MQWSQGRDRKEVPRVIEGQEPGRDRERLGGREVEMKLFPGGWGVGGGKPTTREQKEEEKKRGRVKRERGERVGVRRAKSTFQKVRSTVVL
jgi:hypothetical protein